MQPSGDLLKHGSLLSFFAPAQISNDSLKHGSFLFISFLKSAQMQVFTRSSLTHKPFFYSINLRSIPLITYNHPESISHYEVTQKVSQSTICGYCHCNSNIWIQVEFEDYLTAQTPHSIMHSLQSFNIQFAAEVSFLLYNFITFSTRRSYDSAHQLYEFFCKNYQ